jgi:hypothetical protein
MSKARYPPGWNASRVQRLIDHYESRSDEELAAEDDAAAEAEGMTTVAVPQELMPEIRKLLARHKKSA